MAEEKKKVSAKEVVAAIRAGATDEFLMTKYGVSEKGLQSLFQKLIAAKLLTPADLDQRGAVVDEVEIIEEGAPTKGKSLDVIKELGEKFKISREDLERLKTASLKDIKDFVEKHNLSLSDAKELLKSLGVSTGSLLTQAAGKLRDGTRKLKEEFDQKQSASRGGQSSANAALEMTQEKLKKVGGQAVDKAKELRDNATETGTRAAQKLLRFLKTAAIVGVVGILGLGVVGLGGYLVYKKAWQKPQITQTAASKETAVSEPASSGKPLRKDSSKTSGKAISECNEEPVPIPVPPITENTTPKEILSVWMQLWIFKDDRQIEIKERAVPPEDIERHGYDTSLIPESLEVIIASVLETEYGCLMDRHSSWGGNLRETCLAILSDKFEKAFPDKKVVKKKEHGDKWRIESERRQEAEEENRKQDILTGEKCLRNEAGALALTPRPQNVERYVAAVPQLVAFFNTTADQAIEERKKVEKRLEERRNRLKQCQERRARENK